MNKQTGSGISRSTKAKAVTPPFASGADNGLSVDPITSHVVLGNDAGGNLADLLSDREIPMNGNFFKFLDAQAGNRLFEIDQANGLYRLGDIDGNNNRSFFFADDSPGAVTIGMTTNPVLNSDSFAIDGLNHITASTMQGGRRLLLDLLNDVYSMGDIDSVGNNVFSKLDNINQTAEISFGTGNAFLFLDLPNDTFWLGDIPGISSNTYFYLDGTGDAEIVESGNSVLELGTFRKVYRFGDLSGSNNGIFFKLDDTAGVALLDNLAHNVTLQIAGSTQINGVPGFTGTVTPVNSITVDGGIVTNVT